MEAIKNGRPGGLTEITLEAVENRQDQGQPSGVWAVTVMGARSLALCLPDMATPGQTLPLRRQLAMATRNSADEDGCPRLRANDSDPIFSFTQLTSHSLAAVFAKKTLNQIPFTHSSQNIFALPNRPGSVVQI